MAASRAFVAMVGVMPSASGTRRVWTWLGALAATLLIGWEDERTGWELSLYLFYALPIIFLVWRGERAGAVLLSLISGLTWWVANGSSHPYASDWSYDWAALSRAVYLIIVAVGGNAIRGKQDADRLRIEMLERSQRLEREIVTAAERERQRIGQDLHDVLCQQLAAIGCAAKSLADDLRAGSPNEAAEAGRIEALLKDSVAQTRDLARGMAAVGLEGGSLSAALDGLTETLRRESGVSFRFVERGDVHVADPEAAIHLYRIAQEALNNALKHSGAGHVEVALEERDGSLCLTIEDDGVGLPPRVDAHQGATMGLNTMRYRSRAMGGSLEISPATPRGVRVTCVIRNRPASKP